MQCGHVLIIGSNGSGKQSLAKLASYAAGCKVFEIVLNTGYNIECFEKDIKILFHQISTKNKLLTFLFTTDQVYTSFN